MSPDGVCNISAHPSGDKTILQDLQYNNMLTSGQNKFSINLRMVNKGFTNNHMYYLSLLSHCVYLTAFIVFCMGGQRVQQCYICHKVSAGSYRTVVG